MSRLSRVRTAHNTVLRLVFVIARIVPMDLTLEKMYDGDFKWNENHRYMVYTYDGEYKEWQHFKKLSKARAFLQENHYQPPEHAVAAIPHMPYTGD